MQRNQNITCELCGGNEFYKEAGFYYCKECQTQSQEVQERVFKEGVGVSASHVIKEKQKKTKKTKTEKEKVLSFECYNYILHGMVTEMIDLGAREVLKPVVQRLWFKYLELVGIVREEQRPMLPEVNYQQDAEVIYGRKVRKKRRRSSSGSSSSDDATSSAISSKSTRSRIKTLSLIESSDGDRHSSLANVSLTSLKSTSDTSRTMEKYLQFNKHSKNNLLTVMTKNHLKNHSHDVNNELDCHHITYRMIGEHKLLKNPAVLTKGKLVVFIYLGLLIVNDEIQLGDMLRYIREGHLSYSKIDHFLPEEILNAKLPSSIRTNRSGPLAHYGVRQQAARLAGFLKIHKSMPMQDLSSMCRRYCKELNLPEEVCEYAEKLMSLSKCKLGWTLRSPNYEGRVMGFVMYVLKLLFGLDDETEFHFSKFASEVNGVLKEFRMLPKMFVFDDWIKFIGYRKLVIKEHHFPTQFLIDETINDPKRYFDCLKAQISDADDDIQHVKYKYKIYEEFLKKLEPATSEATTSLMFRHSLTPFKDYIKTILTTETSKNLQTDILKKKFNKTSLDFLMHPDVYSEALNGSNTAVKHRNVNNNIEFIDPLDEHTKRCSLWYNSMREEPVRIISSLEITTKPTETPEQPQTNIANKLKAFKLYHKNTYKRNSIFLKNVSYKSKLRAANIEVKPENTSEAPYVHYNPHERYWIIADDIESMNATVYANFLSGFPKSFRVVLEECARILDMSVQCLHDEFQMVELFLSYECSFDKKKRDSTDERGLFVRKFLSKRRKFW